MRTCFRNGLRIVFFACFTFITAILIVYFVVSAPPKKYEVAANMVNDVTRLNPILVAQVHKPHTIEEISSLVAGSDGPISIGGARHSMGGQVATGNSLHLDMRDFNQIVSFSKENKEITVQSGITWRHVQEYIDPHGLSVTIMQTYANFTVGGSLSVNAHGRYVGQGSIIHSVKSVKVVLADGKVLLCSPEENSGIFNGVIGGYGGIGVIAEATLMLTDNVRVERQDSLMSVADYRKYFMDRIRNDSGVIFHNADLYPDHYTMVRSVSYVKTAKSLTEEARLIPANKDYRPERFAMWVVSEFPGGKWMRENWVDPMVYKTEKIVWRNYEASYDAEELEPHSREKYTYVLQEYFIPIDNFEAFVKTMTGIIQAHQPNVINISIRHARKDSGSLLAWAKNEVFCFVIYYKQGTGEKDKGEVERWTGELVSAAIESGGSYYIPYQLHASPQQFMKAYPEASRFFQLKNQVDPFYKFRNKLWDKYYLP